MIEDYLDEGKFDTPLEYKDFEADLVDESGNIESKCDELEDQVNDVQDRLETVKQDIQASSVNKKINTR